MGDEPAAERRYTDEELREILARAVSAAGSPSDLAARGDRGFTLAEMEGIAAEAGIDPGRVRSEARALALRRSSPSNREFFAERTVPVVGRAPSNAQIVAAIRRGTRSTGTVEETEDRVEWRPEEPEAEVTIVVTREDAGLAVSVFGGATIVHSGVWALMMIGAFIVGALLWLAILVLGGPDANKLLQLLWSLPAFAAAGLPAAALARRVTRRMWETRVSQWSEGLHQVTAEIERIAGGDEQPAEDGAEGGESSRLTDH